MRRRRRRLHRRHLSGVALLEDGVRVREDPGLRRALGGAEQPAHLEALVQRHLPVVREVALRQAPPQRGHVVRLRPPAGAQLKAEALGAGPDDVQSYGKGAIVGVDGEIEHAAALIHPRFGAPVRGALGDASEIIPSTKKMGGPGASLAVPLTSKHSIWEFDHMDAAEMTFPDAPHAGEIVVILALGIGGRPLKRIRPD